MQYASTEHIVAAIGDDMSLNGSAANEVFERLFVREDRGRPNTKSHRATRLRSKRLPGQSARMPVTRTR